MTALVLALALCACGSSAGSRVSGSTAPTVADIMDSAAADDTAADPVLQEPFDPDALPADLSSADAEVDLTTLSSTMVYSEVSQMMADPDAYKGKTVKMEGTFAVSEGADRNYYACLINDAAACCQNGIEFVWNGDHAYPQEYPELGSDITVVGTFDTYEEDGYLYTQLVDAEVSF